MKRIFTTITMLVLLFAAMGAHAQKSKSKMSIPKSREKDRHRRSATNDHYVTAAIKGGANLQYMGGNDDRWDNWIKPGYCVGMFVNYEKRMFGFQGEGMVKTCRYYIKKAAYIHLRTVNVDFPMLVSFRPLGHVPVFDRVKLVAGPQFSFIVSARRGNHVDVKNDFTNADVAAALGLEVDLPLNLHVGIRGLKGLANVNNTRPSFEWFNSSIQATIGFRFLQ